MEKALESKRLKVIAIKSKAIIIETKSLREIVNDTVNPCGILVWEESDAEFYPMRALET